MLDGTSLSSSVAVLGGDVIGSGLAALALERGGHLRVGLEDYAGDAEPSNLQLVARAVELISSHGRRVATPTETLELLDIPRR
jgi:3-keto-5-aminohexanoate cleavage enzyme